MGKKFGFGDFAIHERKCNACDLFEWKDDRDADYRAWVDRWTGPAPEATTKATNEEAKPKPKRKKKRKRKPPAKPRIEAKPKPKPLPIHDPRIGTAKDGRPLAEYFAEVVARPADDAPRLAYADAIADDQPRRALLIRSDVEWERGTKKGPIAPEVLELFRSTSPFRHSMRDGWGRYIEPYARPRYDFPDGWALERGFVGRLRTDPAVVIDPAVRIFELAPIEHLELTNVGDLRAAIAIAVRAQLRTLDLGGLGLVDEDMDLLTEEGVLSSCETLDLRGNRIGPAGVAKLVASARIRAMRNVRLENNPGDPHMQYSYDCHGTIADMFLPATGQDAEDKYGRIEWLHPLD